MDVRQLEILVAVADNGGFSAAADSLHTVQSNVSSHIARLEREMGATLIDRTCGVLTEEGAIVVERARRIQAELNGIVADVGAFRHDVRGSTHLGMIGTTARWLVPRLLAVMGERHRGVHLVVVDATSTSLEPRLSSGSLDAAVVNLPLPDRDLVSEPLFDEDLVLVVPHEHPMATRRSIPISELASLQLLLPPLGTSFRGELDAAARHAKIALRPLAEVDGVRLIASLALGGIGPAILPATAAPPEASTGAWHKLSVTGLRRRQVGIARRRRGSPAAPARVVIEAVREIVASATAPEGLEGLHPPTT